MSASSVDRQLRLKSSIEGDSLLTKSRPIWQRGFPPLIFVLAFVLRILYINHESVSYDEAFSLTVSRLPLREMLRRLIEDFVHPPLHYFVLHEWFRLSGFGVFQARLLSAIFGSLAVVLVYFFSKYLFDERTALLSSLLMAVSQLSIMFSQEPRPYAQADFLVLASCYLFVRALREERALFWWSFICSGILLIYTYYFGVFAIAALALCALIYRKRYRLRRSWIIAGAVATLIVYLPWIASGIISEAAHSTKLSANAAFTGAHWLSPLTAVNFFDNGKPLGLRAASPWWTFVLGGLLFNLPLMLTIKESLKTTGEGSSTRALTQEGAVIASILWLLPFCTIIGLDLVLYLQYDVRYVLFCAAPYYILVGHGISVLPSRALRWGAVALILAYSANALRANYFLQYKENVRDAYVYVENNRKEGDCGIFLPRFATSLQWKVYQADQPSPFRVIPQEGLAAALSECGRVWVVSRAAGNNPMEWAEAEKEKRPVEKALSKINQKSYYGARVELYSRSEK